MITLPNNFINDLIGIMGNVFSDLMPLILLIIGLCLSIWIIESFWGTYLRGYDDKK
jgi:hypothetical protein